MSDNMIQAESRRIHEGVGIEGVAAGSILSKLDDDFGDKDNATRSRWGLMWTGQETGPQRIFSSDSTSPRSKVVGVCWWFGAGSNGIILNNH